MTKSRILSAVLGSGLFLAGLAVGQINAGRHPNLAAAQRLSQQAFEKIGAAQAANEWDMQGHAAKAKKLLEEVNTELRQAAGAANRK